MSVIVATPPNVSTPSPGVNVLFCCSSPYATSETDCIPKVSGAVVTGTFVDVQPYVLTYGNAGAVRALTLKLMPAVTFAAETNNGCCTCCQSRVPPPWPL